MTAIDKQSRLPGQFLVTVTPGIRALEEYSADRLIELAIRVFQNSPDIGFGDEVRTNFEIYTNRGVFDAYLVVWKFDRVQCAPDSDEPSVELTLRLDTEC